MNRPTLLALLLCWPAINNGFLFHRPQNTPQSIATTSSSGRCHEQLLSPWSSSSSSSSPPRQCQRAFLKYPWSLFAAPPSESKKITSAKVTEMASFLTMQLLERALKTELQQEEKTTTKKSKVETSPAVTKSKQPTQTAVVKDDDDDDDFESLFEEVVETPSKPTVKPSPKESTKAEKPTEEEEDTDSLVEAKEVDPSIQNKEDFEAALLDQVYDLEEDSKKSPTPIGTSKVEKTDETPKGSSVAETMEKETKKEPSASSSSSSSSQEETIPLEPVFGEELMPDVISKNFGKPLDVLKANVPPLRESSIPKAKPKPKEEEEIKKDKTEETVVDASVDTVESSEKDSVDTSDETERDDGDVDESAPTPVDVAVDTDSSSKSASDETKETADDVESNQELADSVASKKADQEVARRIMLESRLKAEKRARIEQSSPTPVEVAVDADSSSKSTSDETKVTADDVESNQELADSVASKRADQEVARRIMLDSRLKGEKRARIKQKALEDALKRAEAEKKEKKRAEEAARLKAEEEERKAKEKAEAEARQKAEAEEAAKLEAQKKAEEEAKQKAEEEAAAAAAKMAEEEEARQKAEEEAIAAAKKAEEEEAKLKAEKEAVAAAAAATKKAEEEEAKLMAEEEAAAAKKAEEEAAAAAKKTEEEEAEKMKAEEEEDETKNDISSVVEAAESSIVAEGEEALDQGELSKQNQEKKFAVPSTIYSPQSSSIRVETRKALMQPKSPEEERKLQEKYASMDLGDRAFAILCDLGMINISPDPKDPNYDHSKDDEECDQFWLWG